MKITLKPNQKLFFTSDTHYNHSNICRATTNWSNSDMTRDFHSLGEMNDNLVTNINETVGEDDILIHMGDFSFGGFEYIEEFRNRINCKNIHLFLGNHDHHIENNRNNIRNIFSSVQHYDRLIVKKPDPFIKNKLNHFTFVCMHFPIASWDGMNRGVIHIHGHVHLSNKLRIGNGKSIDVGVDGNNLTPISLEQVIYLMGKQDINKLSLPKDHHID